MVQQVVLVRLGHHCAQGQVVQAKLVRVIRMRGERSVNIGRHIHDVQLDLDVQAGFQLLLNGLGQPGVLDVSSANYHLPAVEAVGIPRTRENSLRSFDVRSVV